MLFFVANVSNACCRGECWCGVRRRNDDVAQQRCAVVVARERVTGGISNLNPLPDHHFNNDIFVQYVHKLNPDFFGKHQRNYFHVSEVPRENTLGFVDVACNDRHTLVLFS